MSFFSADADNVLITAVKQNEEGDAFTLRMIEWAGRKTDVKLTVPEGFVVTATTNLMEKVETQVAPGAAIPINPYEIKSVRLERKK
jgi:alpha-mannosidase